MHLGGEKDYILHIHTELCTSGWIDVTRLLIGFGAVSLLADVRMVQAVLGQNEEDAPGNCSQIVCPVHSQVCVPSLVGTKLQRLLGKGKRRS